MKHPVVPDGSAQALTTSVIPDGSAQAPTAVIPDGSAKPSRAGISHDNGRARDGGDPGSPASRWLTGVRDDVLVSVRNDVSVSVRDDVSVSVREGVSVSVRRGEGAALRADRLRMVRGGRCVLSDVSVAIRPGEVTGILGANGAGKSTLLGALAGELAVADGEVSLNDHALAHLPTARQARLRAVLPQKPSLQFNLSVHDVVAMGAYPFPELSPARVHKEVNTAIDLADARHLASRPYLELSGGEQQRVQFARTLVQVLTGLQAEPEEPNYLLLDEPTASLDPKHQQAILRAAADICHQHEVGVLVVLHDLNLASRWCDQLILLHQGRLRATGTPQQVLQPEPLADAYDIQATVVPDPARPGRPRVWWD